MSGDGVLPLPLRHRRRLATRGGGDGRGGGRALARGNGGDDALAGEGGGAAGREGELNDRSVLTKEEMDLIILEKLKGFFSSGKAAEKSL